MSHRLRFVIYGAFTGALLALVGMAVFGSRVGLRSVDGILIDPGTGRGRSDFVVSSGGMYLGLLIVAMLGGLLIAALVYAFGREDDPAGIRFPLRYLLPTAAITAGVMAYAALRAGLGAVADIESGVVTISVFRLVVVILIAGFVGGAATASVVDALARPGFLGFEGEAVPSSPAAFVREMVSAIGTPTVALVIVAVFAVGLSQLLLNLHGAASVAAFSIVAAVVLGAAALAAYRPWDRSGA